jgi:hypothetical protein
MRWDPGHQSPNLEDRRGQAGPLPGAALLLPLVGRFGWKGLLVAALVFFVARGAGDCGGAAGDDGRLAGLADGPDRPVGRASEKELVHFVAYVFDDVQASWARRFAARGERWRDAKLVVFDDAVQTGCGTATSAVGPFYCPADARIYVDLGFYRELRRRFGAPGDFAQAYVIAHELGHHVEALRGVLAAGDGHGSIAIELQADCLAGVWARDADERGLLEVGDLEEALGAAAAVGDDRIQRHSGRVRPETWTHGSASQREAALRTGYEAGDAEACASRYAP